MRYTTFLIAAIGILFGGCSTGSFNMLGDKGEAVRTVSDANYTGEATFEWKIAKGDRVETILAQIRSGLKGVVAFDVGPTTVELQR